MNLAPDRSPRSKPRYLASSFLLPPMTLPEIVAFAACLLAVQIVGVRLGLGEALWPALGAADVAVWLVLVPRGAESARRRTAIATGEAREVWLP